MGKMINLGNEILAVNPENPRELMYSKDDGRSWHRQFSGSSSVGEFIDLLDLRGEILAMTNEDFYYSRDDGRSWHRR